MRRPLALLLLAAAVAAAAEGTASFALFALAVGLALLTACAGLAVALAASRLRIGRTVLEREVQENQPVPLRFRAEGIERLPVVLEAEEGAGRWFELGPTGGVLEIRVGRRGAYRLLPSRLRLRDALGLFAWPLEAGREQPLLVLPAPEVPAQHQSAYPPSGDDPEPDGLQAHIPGTPLTRIHWPALARGAGLQVRRFTAAPGGLPLVVLETAGAADPVAVDWAVRAAAGHVLALARRGGCRVQLPGDAFPTAVLDVRNGWRAVHRRLATVDADGRRPPQTGEKPSVRISASGAPGWLLDAPRRAPPAGVVPAAGRGP